MPSFTHNLILTAYRMGLVPNPMKKALDTGRVIRQRPSDKHVKKFDLRTEQFEGSPVYNYGVPNDGDPILYYCHGGGYVIGMLEPYFDLTGNLYKALQFPVIVPEYPMPLEIDALSMRQWVLNHFNSVLENYPKSPIILAGDSAGANMALALAQELPKNRRKSIAGLYMLFSWLDLRRGEADYPEHKEEVLLHREYMEGVTDRFRGDLAAADPRISPIFGALDQLPPMRIISADRDMLYEDSTELDRLMSAGNYPYTHHTYEGYGHDFWMFPSSDGRKAISKITANMKEDVAVA